MYSKDILKHLNDSDYIVLHLSRHAQNYLQFYQRWPAVAFTPFKSWGIFAWTDTGYTAEGWGQVVRDAQHSTDGFWTIDINLRFLSVRSGRQPASTMSGYGRCVRLEVRPHTSAHATCAARHPKQGDTIEFGGKVLIDHDGPWYEVHPQTLRFMS
jgi:hypothetical protein